MNAGFFQIDFCAVTSKLTIDLNFMIMWELEFFN